MSIPLGENSQSIMDKVLEEVLFKEQEEPKQMELFADNHITHELESAQQRAEKLRSIFAHEAIKPEAIEKDLQEVDEAIGDVQTVEHLVIQALMHLGARIQQNKSGYELFVQNLPAHLRENFHGNSKVNISFDSPTPEGYTYLGRNHKFVEQLCQFLLSIAFESHHEFPPIARAAEIQTDSVAKKTILVMFRVRNVIKEKATGRQVIAEEMFLWGYEGSGDTIRTIEYEEAKKLLQKATSLTNLSLERQKADLERELEYFASLEDTFLDIATQRTEHLVQAHDRFKELVGGRRHEKASPVLPPDVMGVYILMPKPKMSL